MPAPLFQPAAFPKNNNRGKGVENCQKKKVPLKVFGWFSPRFFLVERYQPSWPEGRQPVDQPASAPRGAPRERRRTIGHGGFGEVYEAWDNVDGELVAIKQVQWSTLFNLRKDKVAHRELDLLRGGAGPGPIRRGGGARPPQRWVNSSIVF